jgi:hypothetical protein
MKYTDCFEKVCTHKILPEPIRVCELCDDQEPATQTFETECCGTVKVCDLAAEYIQRKGHCLSVNGMPTESRRVA